MELSAASSRLAKAIAALASLAWRARRRSADLEDEAEVERLELAVAEPCASGGHWRGCAQIGCGAGKSVFWSVVLVVVAGGGLSSGELCARSRP